MAQVRKFQSGGKTFKINGKTYNTSNSEDMKRLEEMSSNSEHGGIAQQILANVNDAAYNNTLNVYRTADGRVIMEGGLQNIADQYMSQGTQKATQRKDNAINNAFKRRSGKEWINSLDSFMTDWDSKSSSSSSTSSSSDNKIKISGVSGLGGKWEYDDQGLWNEANVNNNTMLRELQLLEQYYNDSQTLSKEDLDKKYDVSGLNKQNLDTYIEMRKSNPNLYSQYSQYFTPNGKFLDNDDFYSTYGWFGFTQDPDAKATRDQKALKEYLATQGFDFDGAENVFYRDKDGNLMVTDDFLTNVLGGDRTGHYWLNDNWANLKTDNGNPNPYSQMRDHIIWNGRIYKQDDAAVLAELQKSGYIDANKAYDAAKAEQIMRTQWSDNPTFAHEAYDPKTRYSEWAHGYKDKGLRYRTLESNLGEGRHLVGYYTNDDPTDNYGFRTERFAIIGNDGKLIQDNVDPTAIAKTENGQYVPGTTYFMTKRLGKDAGLLAGTYIDGTSMDGKPSNTFFYPNPDTGEYFIQDPDLKGVQKGKAVRIPKEIAEMVPKEAWEYFRTNKSAKERLFRKIRNFTNTGFGKKLNKWITYGLSDGAESLLRNDFRKAGLSKEQAAQIVKLLNEWGTNRKYREATGKHDASSIARQQAFIADPETENIVQPFKAGGKIEKHQYGKVLGQQGKTEVKKVNLQESDRKDATVGQSFGLGSKDSKQWSSLDTMELAGAAADLAALGVTIADPTNMFGAVAGGAGSLVNFGVDVKRDGFQAKDLGRLALNLVLDAGTLIPILGDGLQGAKAVRAMKKAAPVLAKAIKTGAIVGVGDAVYNTIDKIAKGESFTISDVRRIINGISGGVTLGRTGLLNQTKGKRTTKFENIEIKGNGIKGLTLTEAEIKSLQGIKDPEKLKDTVVNMWKSQNKKSKLSKAKILEKLDLSEILSTSKRPQWKFWKGFNEVEKIKLPSAKGYRPELTTEQLDNISKKRNGFQNWFWGTGKHRNWWGQVEGDEFLSHYIRTPEGKAHRARKIAPDNPNPKYYKLVQHANPRAAYRLNPWTMPNIVSTQQFPQEMEFTENVSTVPMKRLVFKEGGVLKGQKGLWDLSKDITSKLDLSKLGQPNYEVGKDGLLTKGLDIIGKAQRASMPKIETSLTPQPSITTNYAIDHAYGSGNETRVTKQVGDYWAQRRATEQFGGRPTKENTFPNLSGIFADTAHLASQWGFANQMNKFGKDRKKAYMSGSPEVWNGSGPMRVMLPNFDVENRARGKYLTNLNQSTISTDPMLRASVMKGGYDNLLDSEMSSIRDISNDTMQQWAMNDNIRREDKKLTFDTLNNKKKYDSVGAQMDPITNAETATIKSKLLNDYTVAQRQKLYDYNTIDATINDKKYQMELAIAEGKAKGQDVSSLENMLRTLNSSDYRQSQLSRVYAKKGTKLRSTTEQMLLDNNKNVAKAISKLSDNTIKLILKAMS